ncbi:MAG: DUF6440 family protein [Oscillospiraceae bacterium]|nr:DUF6440 family protein [Oscillospiraceae bacterium]
MLYKESVGSWSEVRILRDKRTGVQYMFVASGYAGGLSPLLDMDGRPVRS